MTKADRFFELIQLLRRAKRPITADWLVPEFHSAISIKIRTGQLSEANAKQVRKEFDLFAAGGLRLAPVSRDAFSRAGDMVKQHTSSLRAGDALHLAMALELGASSIACLDSTLAANAMHKGLGIIEL